jgi:hypothetical protein
MQKASTTSLLLAEWADMLNLALRRSEKDWRRMSELAAVLIGRVLTAGAVGCLLPLLSKMIPRGSCTVPNRASG